jgi:adenine-specific DNA-methyltransferase
MISITSCDIFTPSSIAKYMANNIHKSGSLLEPSVGIGNLLKYIELDNYTIDVCELKKKYIDTFKSIYTHKNINTYNQDYIMEYDESKKYDNIIMNPPYIRIQDLDKTYLNELKSKYKLFSIGNIDIYYIFMYKALQQLNNDGIMISITPSSYLYSKSGKNFISYLITNRLINTIVNFQEIKIFDGISVYTCITKFTKNNNQYINYIDFSDKRKKKINYCDISTNNIFQPKYTDGLKLGDICIFSNGIATLADKVFIHNKKLYNECCWRKIFKVSKNEYKWAIFPYKIQNQILQIMNEQELKTSCPQTYIFLSQHKDILQNRDKGKKIYKEWFSYGRTQAINIILEPQTETILYISTILNINEIDTLNIHKLGPMLYMNGISIKLKKTEKISVDRIIDSLNTYKKDIKNQSTIRGSGWVNISTKILKTIPLIQSQ